ncbi:MAG: PilZ domain-containing protein [Acidiferrobacterales bacterium]
MKSERRDTPRIEIALEAMLNHDNEGFQRCHTRDISLDGAFVETDRTGMRGSALVDLAIKIPGFSEQRIHRFRAQVIRATTKGVGLVFDQVNTDGYAALLEFVYSRQPRAPW